MKLSIEEKLLVFYVITIVIGVLFLANFFPEVINAYLAWHIQLGY